MHAHNIHTTATPSCSQKTIPLPVPALNKCLVYYTSSTTKATLTSNHAPSLTYYKNPDTLHRSARTLQKEVSPGKKVFRKKGIAGSQSSKWVHALSLVVGERKLGGLYDITLARPD